jgi:hypothetical protein
MKVSNQLKKTIQLVIEEKNAQHRAAFQKKKSALGEKVLKQARPLFTKLASLKSQREKLASAITATEKQIEKMGLEQKHYLTSTDKYVLRDAAAEELGCIEEHVSERAILARLATATVEEGAAVLEQLGIKQ